MRERFAISTLLQVGHGQWRNQVFVLSTNAQDLAAGHKHIELRTGFQQVRQGWGGCYDLLEVVEQQQKVFVSQEGFEEVQQGTRSALFEFKHLGNGGNYQVRVANGSERDKRNAVSEIVEQAGGDLEGQAGFADATDAGEGEEAHLGAAQEGASVCHFLFAPNQRGQRDRQCVPGRVTRLKWFSRCRCKGVILHGRLVSRVSSYFLR